MFFRKQKPAPALARTIKTFGLTEAAVREKLACSGLRPEILSHPKGVDILVSFEQDSPAAGGVLLDGAEAKIRNRLGDAVYGADKDRMEEVVGRMLLERGLTMAAAESCTGGLISHMITNIPGSSKYFKQGFVVYADEAKIKTLNVKPSTIEKFGSVSPQTVKEMAENARIVSGADAAVAVSGIAGPRGGTPGKPVGTVFIHALSADRAGSEKFHFQGWRELIKIQSAQAALNLLRKIIQDSS